jgi:glyoxylase-like metal-dependent hydrolase (beta-lactamase superfamily II)
MSIRFSRRDLLQAAGAVSVAASLPFGASASAAAGRVQTRRLAPGVVLLTGPGGFNSVVVESGAGAALIDGGPAADARAVLAQARSDGRRVVLAVNTHWHPHATGCNLLLGKAGVRIVAQENTRLWLQRPIVKQLENERYEALPRQAWPTASVFEKDTLRLGERVLECGRLFQAHTDGDLCVRIPDANVIVAGGAVGVGHYPILDTFTGGWIRGMLTATKALLDLSDEQTQIVAESGAVVGRAHLQAQAEMLETLTERLWQLMRKGLSEEDLVAAEPTREYDATWGAPREFILNTYRGIWGHVREMRGIV